MLTCTRPQPAPLSTAKIPTDGFRAETYDPGSDRSLHHGSAYAEFQENEKGSITVGKLADMALLSDDVLALDPVKIRDVKVLKTWVGGELTYDAEGVPGQP